MNRTNISYWLCVWTVDEHGMAVFDHQNSSAKTSKWIQLDNGQPAGVRMISEAIVVRKGHTATVDGRAASLQSTHSSSETSPFCYAAAVPNGVKIIGKPPCYPSLIILALKNATDPRS